jgi:hypothetical protein
MGPWRPADAASAAGATRPEAGFGDEVSASNAGTLGDCIRQRRDGIVAHELRKERQLALLLGGADAKSLVPVSRQLAPHCSHNRRFLTRRFADGRIVPSSGWEMRAEL